MTGIAPRGKHRDRMLLLRAIEDVLEVQSNGFITKEVGVWKVFQLQRSESTSLTRTVGIVVMQYASETRDVDPKRGLTECRPRGTQDEDHQQKEAEPGLN